MQELEHGMLWLLLSPCASPAWAAAMASVWYFGCSCGYRYVKLDSLCFGVSHECIHRLMVFLGGWEIIFLGQTSKAYHSKSNLTKEGNGGSSSCCLPFVLAIGAMNLVMTRVWLMYFKISSHRWEKLVTALCESSTPKTSWWLDQVGGQGKQLQLSRVALNKVRLDFSGFLISSCFCKT